MCRHTAIVTGGSRGIGRAIVDRLSADGARVLTCGRGHRPDELPESVEWVKADLSEAGAAERLVSRVRELFGPVSLLVNNAGVQVEKTVLDSTDDDWDEVVGVNCRGVFTTCRAVLPDMLDTGGIIINIGSISGSVADPAMALYNATKAFVHGLTRSIAVDHGPKVRANTISPGWVATGMADDAFMLARDPEAARRDAIARHPSGRMGNPTDIANAVAWLASDDAASINGQNITIDGGLTAASPLRPGLF